MKFTSILLFICLLLNLFPAFAAEAASTNVTALLEKMTLKEKVAQMLMVDFRYWDENTADNVAKTGLTQINEQVRRIVIDYKFGAIIYFAQNLIGTEQAYNLTMALQDSVVTNGGIPMLFCADQEGGSVFRLNTGTALPGNMALGAAGDVTYAKAAGEIIGSELKSLGINTNLAPVVDVNNNPNNPVIGLRSYGDDATAVGNLAAATIEGLAEHGVIGCAKHFPGHGDTATDSHYGLPSVNKSKAVLLENELKPYQVAIENGIDMIMSAHILYPQLDNSTLYSQKTGQQERLPATLSKTIITDLLKGELGFEGIVVTDAMNMAGISASWNQVQAVKVAINAGIDMICMPCTLDDTSDLANLDAIINGVVSAVQSGEIPEARLNDAVTRILSVKEKHGILDYYAGDYPLSKALETVGSDANRETEREIAAAAVTLVKNTNNVLPLKLTSTSKILMLCPYDNERAQLVMGWNRAKNAGLVPNGAVMDYYRFSDATLNTTVKSKIDWADTVLVISEVSSAARMAYDHWLSSAPNAFVNYAASLWKKTIVMSADKPYDVQMYPNADAIMAVYGCKGSGIDPTEALVGGVTTDTAAYGPNIIAGVEVALGVFPAKGKLPVNIYAFDNVSNSYTTNIVYPRGFGITYDYSITVAADADRFTVYAPTAQNVFFLTAGYDASGRFVGATLKDMTLPQGISYIDKSSLIGTLSAASSLRLFTWTALSGMVPIASDFTVR